MDFALEPLAPIFTAHLFPQVEAKLIELLRSLSPDDWERQTLAPKWKVKDVVAHLLDTQVRKLDASRRAADNETFSPISPAELLALVNSINAEGVRRYRDLTPSKLISRMEAVSKESAAYHQSLDPFAPAIFPVSWAGEDQSPNWFDTAREFTERWHHQQQIRIAVQKNTNAGDKLGIMTRDLCYPVLDCFMRALPHAYRNISSASGSLAKFNISGECGGSWYLLRNGEAWMLNASPVGQKISETTIPQEIAWRIFTKGISRDAAESQVQVGGNVRIGRQILEMVSIVG